MDRTPASEAGNPRSIRGEGTSTTGMIHFTKHAEQKFSILKKHDFFITKAHVLKTITRPDRLDYSRLPLLIAQRQIDKNHVLRVVYKVHNNLTKIITFYPGRTKQYE